VRVTAAGLEHGFPPAAPLFRGLDLELVDGDVVALTGPSGSGKSTLLSILALWTRPSRGEVSWEGVGSAVWVPQNPVGVARRAVLDHAVLPLLAQGWRRADAEPRALEALERFGLEGVSGRRFADLSGGEAQRLMLARASLSAAGLLLVDEPTAQLDPTSAASVVDVLGALASSGTIVVIATHDPRVRDAGTSAVDLGRHR
jgi:ABC-type lipoprotein export system ATPase subunit